MNVINSLLAIFNTIKPLLVWLVSNYGTYAATISAVLAAITTISNGDVDGGIRQIMQILTILLTGGVVMGLTHQLHATRSATNKVFAQQTLSARAVGLPCVDDDDEVDAAR